MNYFLITVEFLMYFFAIYLAFKKKELAIVYLPVLFFANNVIGEHAVSSLVYYGIITGVLLYIVKENTSFMKSNIFAMLLLLYFFVLMAKSTDLGRIREDLFNVSWLLLCIPIIPVIYQKYSRETVMKELGRAAFVILALFIVNTVISSLLHYDVNSMYGITSGLLYGNLYATDFNILSIAVFLLLFRSLSTRNILYLLISIAALAFIVLTLRRSVITLSILGIAIVMLLFVIQNINRAIIFGLVLVMGFGFVLTKTNFADAFNDRYELRRLDERSLDEEKRLVEYEMLYRDMFVYGRYSTWFGFGLFNSAGNYGEGRFYDRTLHGDLTSLAHSSGLLGVLLYLLAIITVFFKVIRSAARRADNLLILFCAVVFVTYTVTGRITQIGAGLLLFLTLNIPLTEPDYEEETVEDEEEAPEHGSLVIT